MKKPGIITGATSGALLTAPLIAIFYLGWKLAGLPFAPFDVFDWAARALPGSVVTFGIDSMVKVIRALDLGSTATAAKTAEQLMAIAGLLITGILAGAILFAILRAWEKGPASLLGIVLGAAVGVPVLLISHSLSRTPDAGSLAGGIWTIAAFLIWGATFGWVYNRLRARSYTAAPAGEAESGDVERVHRRRFLVRFGGATAAITVAGAMVGTLVESRRGRVVPAGERWSANNPLPNAGAAVEPAPGARQEFTPLDEHYRIDINTISPVVKEEDWRLKIGGLVQMPLELTLAEIRDNYEPMHQLITLSCISNQVAGDLIGTTRWTGVSLQRLLPGLGLKPEATHLKLSSTDGFYEVVALETINRDDRVMLAYDWDGVPLATEHGFPLRIYIPDLYGMKQPKWIESIEAMDHWEAGYWVARGWNKEAHMKATSVIDTVAVDATIADGDGRRLVPVGGIAHAGARGISKVELRVDEGEWREAELRAPLSEVTWVIWRYDWPFQEGEHTLTVRCYDGNGALQTPEPSEPHPDGASGLHSRSAAF